MCDSTGCQGKTPQPGVVALAVLAVGLLTVLPPGVVAVAEDTAAGVWRDG